MYGISVDFVVESEKDTEASAGKGRMCRFEENVIGWKRAFWVCELLRCQELFDREMGKLDNLEAHDIDDGN